MKYYCENCGSILVTNDALNEKWEREFGEPKNWLGGRMNKTESILKALSELCAQIGSGDATINYSVYSKQFYIHFPCDIKEGIGSHSVCEHRDTIEEAAMAAIKAIQGKPLVFNVGGERKEVFFYSMQEGSNEVQNLPVGENNRRSVLCPKIHELGKPVI